MAAWNRFLDLIRYGMDLWCRRALRRAFLNAQLALGERMYTAGIDDGQLAAQIRALDEKMRKAQKGLRTALVAARKHLFLQLATAASVEEGPLPGADAEYQQARQAQAALREFSERRPAVRTTSKAMAEPVGVGT
jgi:hypothetical protein